MSKLAIDSKLRGCDVVALKVEDVAPSGYLVDRATVRQKKAGQPVRFELTEQTRQAVDDYLRAAGKKPPGTEYDNETVRPARLRMDCPYWVGPAPFRHPLASTNQGDPDLSAHWQSTSGAAPARPHQDREHGALPWHRGR